MRVNVIGDKGGVGKSQTAVHLGAFLGLRFGEGTTAVVDTDPNESILDWGRSREAELEELGPFPFEIMRGDGAWRDFENVVFDSQGRPSDDDLAYAVQESDVLVVPATPEALSMRTLVPFLERVEEYGGSEKAWVLVTMAPWWNGSGRQMRDALDAMEEPRFGTFRRVVRRRQAFEAASLTGRLVFEVSSRRARDGWRDYEKVGEEMVAAVMERRRTRITGRG